MSGKGITDELVRQVAEDLQERYKLDDDEVRELGARLATGSRSAENLEFAESFFDRHRKTFDRLAR